MKQISPQAVPSVKLFSIEEVKNCLSVSRPTVNRLIASNILRTVKIGRAVRVPESALIEFVEHGGNSKIAAV